MSDFKCTQGLKITISCIDEAKIINLTFVTNIVSSVRTETNNKYRELHNKIFWQWKTNC